MQRLTEYRQARRLTLGLLLVVWLPAGCAIPAAGGSATSAQAAVAEGTNADDDGEKYYDVDCDRVDDSGNRFCLTDRGTYVGWRTFHATCHACHGQNAVGSSFAPSLLKPIDRDRFFDVVANGYTGQMGVMPGWGENPNVKDFIDELYAYQQARADGVLRPGRPKRKD